MGKMMRNLGRNLPAIAVCIVLLVVVAMCDLALPDYISDIVNVGIQQSGVEDNVPEEIRGSELDKLLVFLDEGEREAVLASYAPADGDGVHALGDLSDDERADLSALLAVPQVIVYFMENEEMAEGMDMEMDMGGVITGGFDLPEGVSFFDMLAAMPAEQQAEVTAAIREAGEALRALGDGILVQLGVSYVQAEYDAIGIDLGRLQSTYIRNTGLMMLAVTLLGAAGTILNVLIASRVAASFSRDTRRDLYTNVIRFSGRELGKFSTASLITRSTNDIQQVQMVIVMTLRIVIFAPVMGIGALLKVMGDGSGMTWIIGLAVGILFLLIIILAAVAMPRFSRLQKLLDRLNQVSREILTGLSVIRAFSRERHEEARFEQASGDLMRTQLFVGRVMNIMMPAMTIVMNGIMVLIIWVGADAVAQGTMQVGNIMAFIQYTTQIIMSFLMLSMMSIMLPRAIISFNRIAQVLGTETAITDPERPQALPEDSRGRLEFNNVSFKYPGAEGYTLQNISFTAKPGETTAVIGSTGSGKTTLVSLIPRFYDVTEGAITMDGVDIREVSLHDLRRTIGYVPQKGLLFTGTVASNIAYGIETEDMDTVREAVEIAQAADFIAERQDGYESNISQGGGNVSGGQRQRLAIARAVAKKPSLYVFDDSFSALDYKTDAALRAALKERTAGAAVLIVAQRISTILHAENIIVLDEGRIAGQGNHEQLMKSCEVYRQIALSQLSQEEAGA